MKNKIFNIFTFIIINLILIQYSVSDEINFEANIIELLDKDKKIVAKKNVKILTDSEIITSEEMVYSKDTGIAELKGNLLLKKLDNSLKIYSDELIYKKKVEEITLKKNVLIELNQKYKFKTDTAQYYKLKNKITVDNPSTISDNLGNSIYAKKSIFSIDEKLLKIKSVKMQDVENNVYYFENAIINFKRNEIIGDNVKIDFVKKSFGNEQNDPRLRGNYVFRDKNSTVIKRGVFTTCKKDGNCPPWQFKAGEIKHDKLKKTIYYKNAWLEIYDKPVFYFPKFFHPDPTVERQSGFLFPKIKSSSSHGDSLSIPYYKVISENKDFTFTPKIYTDNKALFQNEYRQVNKNSSHILDFSLNRDNSSSKTHFFSNSLAKINFLNFESSELEINIETSSNNNYLKSHKIKSEITNNNSLLNSFISLKANTEDLFIETKFEAYEDLTAENDSDKYQYLLPGFELSKNFNNNFTLLTNGYHKNYDTNVFEKVLINDLKFSSLPKINSKGFVNKLDILLKNVTTDSKNSNEYTNDFRSQNFGSMLYDISYPMRNIGNNYKNLLTGKASIMYSPNKNKNLQDLDRKLNISNIFSHNRLGLTDSVEGGQSLTLGVEYELIDKSKNSILKGGLATVLRDRNETLPTKSTLNNKSSDLIGSINFKPKEEINLNYNFSVDNNLESTNYNFLSADLTVNKFVTTFEYLQEDDEVGTENYYSGEMQLLFNESNSLKYRTRRNKKTDLTEYYNLIYEYKNDCLTAAIQYNKDYYSDKDLEPNEEIFFSISIVPFSSVNSPSKRK